MAVTNSTAARNAAANGVVDLIDAGTGAGKMVIKTAADAVLVTFTLNDPAFGDASSGTAALDVDPAITETASGAGIAAKFDFTDSDDTVVFSGSVTATGGGGDLTLDNTSIASGQTVNITGFDYTALSS